jgi:antibiotic biosynthesis monooxygenase (ABM) superfamily enzyme
MADAARAFEGHLATDVMRPASHAPDGGPWRIVVRFATEDDLRRWLNSPTAARWRATAEALTRAAPHVERVNGLEAWFALPNRTAVAPPPRWKTAITSALGIYPLLLVMPRLLAPVTRALPPWLASLATVVVMSPLITWVVMPAITRLFRPWLYAGDAPAARPPRGVPPS